MLRSEMAKTLTEAEGQWEDCFPQYINDQRDQIEWLDCTDLQYKMCRYYSSFLQINLREKNIIPTFENIFFSWNQGFGIASILLQAIEDEVEEIKNQKIRDIMAQQIWNRENTTFNPKEYYDKMINWLRAKGL
jgi:hypothetical protein